jgi:hypothetical protein
MDSSVQFRRETAVRLQVARLAQAIQRADTFQLAQVLGDAEIPSDEAAVSRARGCRSNRWAVAKLRRTRARPGAPSDLPLDGVMLQVQQVTLSPSGAAIALVRVIDVIGPRKRFAEFTMNFDASGDGFVPVRAVGLMSGLCGLAVAP